MTLNPQLEGSGFRAQGRSVDDWAFEFVCLWCKSHLKPPFPAIFLGNLYYKGLKN